jgi:hypothetical protein
LDIPIP